MSHWGGKWHRNVENGAWKMAQRHFTMDKYETVFRSFGRQHLLSTSYLLEIHAGSCSRPVTSGEPDGHTSDQRTWRLFE